MPTQSQTTAQDQQQIDIRQVLADATTAIIAAQQTKGLAALTVEDCAYQQLQLIQGASTDNRPNQLDRITAMSANLTAAVKRLQAVPDSAFQQPTPQDT